MSGWIRASRLVVVGAAAYFVYDIRVREDQVSEEQIEAWVDEAEAGYDGDELKRRGRGRPGRGAEPMQVVAVRLTAAELAALDAAAERIMCRGRRRSVAPWRNSRREGLPERSQARGQRRGRDPGHACQEAVFGFAAVTGHPLKG